MENNPLFIRDSVELSDSNDRVIIIDQTKLPGELVLKELTDCEHFYEAIKRLEVRGAPAIGVAAAFGAAVSLKNSLFTTREEFKQSFYSILKRLGSARPTAVNLSWALDRMAKRFVIALDSGCSESDVIDLLIDEAVMIKEEDIAMCYSISERGLSLLQPGMGIMTQCNAGHLAVSRYGTALGPVHLGNQKGYAFKVYTNETRPLLQGARLTAYELQETNCDVTLICDNMAGMVMSQGKIDAVLAGCDRIAANGDVANKIGTLPLAILASHYKIPFYILGPSSTIDENIESGDKIIIEEREPEEVTEMWYSKRMAPANIKVYNPAFDVTPAKLITAIITDKGIFNPGEILKSLK